MALSKRAKPGLAILLLMPAFWLTAKFLCLLFPPAVQTELSKEILDEKGRLLHVFLSKDQKWRLSTSEKEIPERLADWMIWKEDKYFYLHPGINPVAVVKSAFGNLISGKRTSGASTITMQAVKLSRPAARNWTSKISESLKALYWEMALSKEEILAYYFSHLPFGGNVEGFRSASRIYFGKELHNLSPAQWAALVVIPNKPAKNHPLRNPEQLTRSRNKFLSRMYRAGKLDAGEYKAALLEPFFAGRYPMPRQIPHLARQLESESGFKVQTTLDENLQSRAEQLLQFHHIPLKMNGIKNAALLLADIQTGDIKAWIGNPDFEDKENSGQVDGVLAIRSPGSTLKPFIFALGFQKGLITPKSVLYDIPSEYQDYAPENYDKQFHGAVTADEALLHSLNMPAIELLNRVKVDTLLACLDKMGMSQLLHRTRQPGLSMAAGGCGTNLYELVQAYRILALDGKNGRIRIKKDQEYARTDARIMEAGSAELVKRILSVKNRGEVIFSLGVRAKEFDQFVWKTGTSFRRKDGWCLGFGQRYVLGIWLGNFSGQGHPALSGLETAAPVFQKIISELERNPAASERKSNLIPNWKLRKICSETGLKPGPYCKKTTTDFFLPLVSSQAICRHRKATMVNKSGSMSFCNHCRPEREMKEEIFDNPDPGWKQFAEQKGHNFSLPPPHNPACQKFEQEMNLSFLYPMDGKAYFLNGSESLKTAIRLKAPAEAFPVRIYENGNLLGSSKSGEEIPVLLKEGEHRFSAVGQNGGFRKISFWVRTF